MAVRSVVRLRRKAALVPPADELPEAPRLIPEEKSGPIVFCPRKEELRRLWSQTRVSCLQPTGPRTNASLASSGSCNRASCVPETVGPHCSPKGSNAARSKS